MLLMAAFGALGADKDIADAIEGEIEVAASVHGSATAAIGCASATDRVSLMRKESLCDDVDADDKDEDEDDWCTV